MGQLVPKVLSADPGERPWPERSPYPAALRTHPRREAWGKLLPCSAPIDASEKSGGEVRMRGVYVHVYIRIWISIYIYTHTTCICIIYICIYIYRFISVDSACVM